MPDIENKVFMGDLDAYILRKSFEGKITTSTSINVHDSPDNSLTSNGIFAGKIAGIASNDRYLLKCKVSVSARSNNKPWGIVKLCKQVTLTGQTAFTVNAVSVSELVTLASAHSYANGDIVKFSGVTSGTPDLTDNAHFVVSSPSGSTFTLRGGGIDITLAHTSGGTCTRVYQKSNETLLEQHTFAANVGSPGGQGGVETYSFDMVNAVGQKITNGQEFMVYLDEGDRGTNAGDLDITVTFVCVDVPTGADPTVLQMVVSQTAGNVTFSGTETNLFTSQTTLQHYATWVFLNSMGASDRVTLRVYIKDQQGATERLYFKATYQGVQGEPSVFIPYVPTNSYRVTIQRNED